MEFDDDSVDVSGVDDRRGAGPGGGLGGRGMAIGGGAGGILALIVAIIFGANVLGDGSSQSAIDLGQSGQVVPGESNEELSQRCNTDGALDEYTDCRLIKTYNVLNDTWDAEFSMRSLDYRQPRLTFFSGAVATGCGQASSQVGPFYCPPDEGIYLDLDFLAQLQEQFGAEGEFAQAYILAHEGGHHLQTVLGVEEQVRRAQERDPSRRNDLSVRLELQADCFAGVWTKLADQSEGEGLVLRESDVQEALEAAAAVGDDRIQQTVQGRVNPETFTHGSSEQRQQWFARGYESGDIQRCDTFTS